MPSIMKSPWAKLITRMTPKIRPSPTHIRPYTAPIRSPAVRACRKLSIVSVTPCLATKLAPHLHAGPFLDDLCDRGEVGGCAKLGIGDGEHLPHRRAADHR